MMNPFHEPITQVGGSQGKSGKKQKKAGTGTVPRPQKALPHAYSLVKWIHHSSMDQTILQQLEKSKHARGVCERAVRSRVAGLMNLAPVTVRPATRQKK